MSKAAIKLLFEASKKRRILRKPKNKRLCVEEPVVVLNEKELKHAFEMIKNWEGDVSSLISFYNNLDEDQYQYVLANRDELCYETNTVLWPDEFNPPLGRNSTLKVVELTEEGYRRILLENLKRRETLINERIEKLTIPSMPRNHLEEVSDKFKMMLSAKQTQLETTRKSIDTGKYITPSKRLSVVENNPVVVALVNDIQKIKNELEKIDQSLKVLRDEWTRNETIKLRHKIEQELALSGM